MFNLLNLHILIGHLQLDTPVCSAYNLIVNATGYCLDYCWVSPFWCQICYCANCNEFLQIL